MSDRVTVTITEGVADVRLNRPDKLNALDPATFVALVETSARLAEDTSVRVVVLSGEGRGFCSGLDFSSFMAMAGSAPASDDDGDGAEAVASAANLMQTGDRITHLAQQAVYGWTELPVPVIAAVWGHCLGGGLQIAVGCDLRIVHPEAKLSVLEIRWGLTPDMTITASLPRLVGLDVAKEMTWTGRTVSGEEALRLGLATQLSDDPYADAMALAREIAKKNPAAIRGAKRLFEQSGRVSLAEQFAAERETIGSVIGTPNQVEAVTAFFEKRDPVFSD
jgi:enoyl-CoA hydratase/carnithine racemase